MAKFHFQCIFSASFVPIKFEQETIKLLLQVHGLDADKFQELNENPETLSFWQNRSLYFSPSTTTATYLAVLDFVGEKPREIEMFVCFSYFPTCRDMARKKSVTTGKIFSTDHKSGRVIILLTVLHVGLIGHIVTW